MPRTLLAGAIVGGLLLAGLVGGCKPAPRPGGGSTTTRAENTRKHAETLAVNVISSVAASQAKAIPELARKPQTRPPGPFIIIAPTDGQASSNPEPSIEPPSMPALLPAPSRSPPRPGSPAVIAVRVSSVIPYPKEAEADEAALAKASETIEQKLAALDPPVHYRPTINETRNEFVRKDSRTTRPPDDDVKRELEAHKLSTEGAIVEYDVEMTADQVRELRARDRIAGALRVLGAVMFAAAGLFLCMRLDEGTKGYLTHWLACAAVVLVGGAVAVLYFM